MLLYFVLNSLGCLAIAMGKDVFSKAFKTIPSVSNSLVNLGKMDIAFYFNAKPQDYMMKPETSESSSLLTSRVCPCSGASFLQDSSPKHPFEFIDKILSSNNLLSFKEPSTSALCCDSHEQVQEDILFEFTPRRTQMAMNPMNSNFPFPSSIFNQLPKPSLPLAPVKNRAIEIFLFPKRKDAIPANLDNTLTKKKDIKNMVKIVGDADIKNEFKTENFVPPLPKHSLKIDTKEDKLKQEGKTLEEVKDIDKGNTL